MINPKRKLTRAVAFAILFCFTSLTGAQPLYAIPPNTQLPVLDKTFGPIGANVPNEVTGNTMNIQQTDKTSIIKWQDFSIGADAAVNFNYNGEGGFNSLNYVTGTNAPISEIYGQLTALGGNIFIANPAGVQIGNSAQINVGSLYVTNKDIENAVGSLKELKNAEEIRDTIAGLSAGTNAQLMSLGAITNATNVTFDGARIVLDTDRIYTANGDTGELEQVNGDWFKTGLDIITTDKDNVVLGYTKDNPRGVDFDNFGIKVVANNGNVTDDELSHGYMWVHDLNELQAMNYDTSGWYALRNSIDAYDTASIDDGKGFDPIGDSSQAFTGRFDGLGYSIFGLNINNRTINNVGLFGYAQNATIRNFTLNSSEIKGGANTGAAVGHADGGKIENVTNTGNVTGDNRTGGIVGKAENNVAMSSLINIGKVTGGVGTGGVVGSMSDGTLGGDTYNLGSVTGTSSVGGIAGSVTNATIGNEVTQDNPDAFQIFNQLNVTGNYNVGGIAGTMSGGKITNTANYGNITATGKDHNPEKYSYHTAVTQQDNLDGATLEGNLATIDVAAANAGGIAGETKDDATISDVLNDGDVTSEKADGEDFYKAGNVGGIVGRAENTDITNAENKENTVAGAHNVGGVAGFLGGDSTVDTGVNNGGDITATGARKFDGSGFAKERVRPYADGANEIFNIGNIGGIVGYLFGDNAKVKNSGNRGTVHSANIEDVNIVPETAKAANVGGVVGKIDMENPTTLEAVKNDAHANYKDGVPTILNSYSTGEVRGYTGVGGVAGMMYNGSVAGSYNLGTVTSTRKANADTIEPLNMGGVVGDTTELTDARATIYDVYNAGQIGDPEFNFYGRHVGGVVGRLSGELEKAYNTGDIYNGFSVTGGVVGWWYRGNIRNVFNTGNVTAVNNNTDTGSYVGGIVGALDGGEERELSYAYNLGTIRSFSPADNTYANYVSGIIGAVEQVSQHITIDNVYTSNNIYAAKESAQEKVYEKDNNAYINAVWNEGIWNANLAEKYMDVKKTFYVKLYENIGDFNLNTDVKEVDRYFSKSNSYTGFTFDNEDFNEGWRIYDGTTPILNAFLPNAEEYFSNVGDLGDLNIDSVQYGTAANPLLTIINANGKGDVTLDWGNLNSSGNASFAVYGGGLTLENFGTETGYYRGTIYADGALNITGVSDKNFNLGSSANLYGTSVKLDAKDGDATIYGNVTSTNGDISISGGDIEIIGKLASSKEGDKAVSVKNIAKNTNGGTTDFANLNAPNVAVSTVSDAYAHTPNAGDVKVKDGNITVNASGAAEVLYGNLGTGSVSTAGEFKVTGGVAGEDGKLSGGSVYVDSDLSGTTGNINLSAGGEVLLDITNIAKANENDKDPNGAGALHKFLEKYKAEGGNSSLTLKSDGDDEIIAIDMWGDGKFDLNQYNDGDKTFGGAIQALGEDLAGKTHIWISDAEQLKGIQDYYDRETDQSRQTDILKYNFALKGNIDSSALEDYKAIGEETGYSGTFDGRDFRIIGLNSNVTDTSKISSGIFGTLTGKVKDLRVYASKFFGDGESAGAIASEVTEGGKITGVTTFGNTVTAEDGAAGGIAGKNSGSILESTASDSVTASGANAYAGGVAGVNTGSIGEKGAEGESAQITADSAVRSGTNGAAAIGGVVGKNENGGKVWLANSLGVTTGANAGSTGGIAGTNSGTMTSLYNESIVTGGSSVGGVAGDNSGTMTNAVNATRVTGTGTNTGGLVGNNSGTVDSGRNAGVITGKTSVGGMVGSNENSGILQNLSNAIVAAITGKNYVGGIAGSNAGSIKSDNNLTNEGTVSGTKYVGGIAGENKGTIENVLNETLVLKTEDGTNAMYFGGIAGTNSGTITNATNNSNVSADGAEYVGGIVGQNTNTGTLVGELTNKGNVSGKDKVGGLAGENKNPVLLQGTKDENGETIRLVVTNAGKVSASGGSAGGIFYNNTEDIINADLTNTNEVVGEGNKATGGLFGTNSGNITNSTLTNTGTVTGNGVTGGLIGENSGAVTGGSKLTNSGTVKGGDNTGGLIGKNSGDVSFSSLINEYGAEVTGGDNTGGLIGKNTGEIKGGRGEGNDGMTMYTDKIYNNGAVSGASNVGGLIGNNAKEHDKTGSLYAAYNTGTVFGTGNNVGGIVGTNAGTVSSIFNTIMTATGENQSVTGASNVGGLIGSNTNTGTLSFAYNTTTVNGSNAGGLVGNNAGKLSDAYSTSGGNLVGAGTEKGDRIYNANDSNKNNKDTYKGFTFTDDSEWTIYDGYSAPLLKVFLTEAKYAANENFTYNGQEQQAGVEHVTAADGKKAYQNANELLTALGYTDADSYMAFYSDQIAASDENGVFNPNNLGYYIKSNIMDIAQKELTISDIIASIMYGGDKFTSVDGGSLKGVIGTDDVYIEGWNMNDLSIDNIYRYLDENGRYAQNRGVRNTADVLRGEDGSPSAYANSFAYAYSNLSLAGGKAKNYKLADGGAVGGKITVTPAKLTVNADDASAVYGSDSWNYGYKLDGLANEDTAAGLSEELSGIKYDNTAAFDGTDGRYTADARRYEGAISVNLTGVDLKNYEVVAGNKGTAAVTPAKLTITADDQSVLLGTRPEYTGTAPADLGNQLVNGDSLDGFSYIFGVADTGLETEIGRHEGVIGLFAGGHFYGGGTHDLSTLSSVFHNYDVTVDAGTLTVSAGDNFGHLHWLHRGGERVRNFRERKAGLHFVDGGMIYEEDM